MILLLFEAREYATTNRNPRILLGEQYG